MVKNVGCWSVPEGYKLVGIDASGLELRMLAHYMNDANYIEEVINEYTFY